MSNLLVRAALLWGAIAMSSAASAEDPFVAPISPIAIQEDVAGLNLATGKIAPEFPVLSIPAAPRLTFDRIQNAAPFVKGDEQEDFGDGNEIQGDWTVHTANGTSEAFHCQLVPAGWYCSNKHRSGSALTKSGRHYTQKDTGAYYYFGNTHVHTIPAPSDPYPKWQRLYYVSTITYPDGEIISYQYDTAQLPSDPNGRTWYRPERIHSNTGYYISITYQGNVLGENGWGTPAQVTIYADADPSTPLARMTYNANGTATDLGGRVYQGVTGGSMGLPTQSTDFTITLPGQSSPTVDVTKTNIYAGNGDELVSSITRDGAQYNYAYTGVQYTGALNDYTYSSVSVTGPAGYNAQYAVKLEGARQTIGMANRIKSATDANGHTTHYQYEDTTGRLIGLTAPEGNAISLEYDAAGNIKKKTSTSKPGSGLASIVEEAHVDLTGITMIDGEPQCSHQVKCWRPQWIRDARGNQTDFEYNSLGQPTAKIEPADADGIRRKTIIEYSSGISRKTAMRVCGVGTTCGTTQEIRTEYSHWGNTFLPSSVRQVDQAGSLTAETTYSYDNAGRLLVTDGPLAGTADASYNRYDIHGRKTWEIGPAGTDGVRQAKRYTYRDADDKVTVVESGYVTDPNATSLTQALSRIDTSYDTKRNPIRAKVSSGGTTLQITDTSYDARNQPLCTAVRMNPAVFASVTTNACVAGTAGNQGPDRIAKNIYNSAGQLLKLQRAVGTAIQQDYATYTYTANGQQASVTDANGNRAGYTYDGHDRLWRWNFPSKTTAGQTSTTDYEQYGYDANGNRTSLRKRDGSTLTYTYDNLNRNTVKVVPSRTGLTAAQTRDVYTGYDLRNAPVYVRFDSGAATSDGLTYGYDGLGRQTSSALKMDGITRTLTYGHDIAGRRTSLTHPDGQVFTYQFDAAARTTGILHAATSLASFTYNNLGLPATLGIGVTTSYGYDNLGRLTGLTHDLAGTNEDVGFTLGYNAASQLSSRTVSNDAYGRKGSFDVDRDYAVNGLNQYVSAGTATFTYDANGNLTSDGSKTYVYDVENRMVSATGATLRYDPLGRLYETVGGGVTTRFLTDGDELVGEYNAAGTMTQRYVHGARVDDPIILYQGASVSTAMLRRLRANWQGSIVSIADNAGYSTGINGYDEWGLPNADANGNSINSGRFQYTGQAWIPELGMYYYKARIYSPTLGRFLQTDPIGYEDQINLYGYVANDPINAVDPTGMVKCNGDSRCGAVHTAAAEAKSIAEGTATALQGLASAINGGDLSQDQQNLQSAFERKFGAGSATVKNLTGASKHFSRLAAKIGDPGKGAKIQFTNSSGLAEAVPGGGTISIGNEFFGGGGKTLFANGNCCSPLSQAFIIFHEAGHLVGKHDLIRPDLRALGFGRQSYRGWGAYGSGAANHLGTSDPSAAAMNNDNYNCLAYGDPACGP